MNNTKVFVMIAAVVLVALVVFLVVEKSQKHEKFCGACQGLDRKVCPNRALIHKLYNEGVLTENSPMFKTHAWPETSWDKFLAEEDSKPSKPCDCCQ